MTDCETCDVCVALQRLKALVPVGTHVNRAVYVIEREGKNDRTAVMNLKGNRDLDANWDDIRSHVVTLIDAVRDDKEYGAIWEKPGIRVQISEVSKFRVFVWSLWREEEEEEPTSSDPEAEE